MFLSSDFGSPKGSFFRIALYPKKISGRNHFFWALRGPGGLKRGRAIIFHKNAQKKWSNFGLGLR